MKELTIEEKAKAYDEIIERLKDFRFEYRFSCFGNVIEEKFPELKEVWDDNIKDKLIKLVKMSNEFGGFALHKWEANEMLDWIERKGKQEDHQI